MANFLSLNVRGIAQDTKQFALSVYIKRANAKILLLQETNLLDTSSTLLLNDHKIYINEPINLNSGTAIAFHSTLAEHLTVVNHTIIMKGHCQAIEVILFNTSCIIINIYMPQNNNIALQLMQQLDAYMSARTDDPVIILGGDWNVTTTPEDRVNCIELRSALKQKLIDYTATYNLRDVWRFFHPDSRTYTYTGVHHNSPRARLERFYVSKSSVPHIVESEIIQSFSDHAGVTMFFRPIPPSRSARLWKFKASLTEDEVYNNIIKNIIEHFSSVSNDEPLSTWDNMKTELRVASQRYEAVKRRETLSELKNLERSIQHYQSKHHLTEEEKMILERIETTHKNYYKSHTEDSQKTHQSNLIHEINQPTPYFLKLAKERKLSSTIQQLRTNGAISSNQEEINKTIHSHFSGLFTSESPTINDTSPLFQDLYQLSETERVKCDADLTASELTNALYQMKKGKAPGMDGFSVEFYQFYWKSLQHLFRRMTLESFRTNKLPVSTQQSLLILIPKGGDRLELNNWRPISLPNTDYKIISKSLSTRLGQVLPNLLSSDQSFCVPGRSIFTNIHLVRDSIHYANDENIPLGIVSLDQKSAFDRVEHTYLHHILKTFGFGENFRNIISTLYSDVRCFIRLGNNILKPFHFGRGIRQGDPLSGLLFSISIEPFLQLCNKELKPFSLPVPDSDDQHLAVTAYADDVNFLITREEGFEKLYTLFMQYGSMSGAALNNSKSSGLFTGAWRSRTDSPLDFKWSNEGGKFLGVFLGSATWQEKNWYILQTKAKSTLSNWRNFNNLTSLRGRRIVINQLVGSKFNHALLSINPTKDFLTIIDKLVIHYIWNGRHWLHPNYIYSPVSKGGLGVTHIPSRVNTFRMKFIQSYLEAENTSAASTLFQAYNFKKYDNLPSPQSIFIINHRSDLLSNLQPYYRKALETWQSFDVIPTTNETIAEVRSYPLWDCKLLTQEDNRKHVFAEDWRTHAKSKIGDLMKEDGSWHTIDELAPDNLTTPTKRRLAQNLTDAKEYVKQTFPKLHTASEATETQTQFSFTNTFTNTEQLIPAHSSTLYTHSLITNLTQNPRLSGLSCWSPKMINWFTLHTYPTVSRDADISWKLLHNRGTTPHFLNKCKIRPTPDCPWCPRNQIGSLLHMFIECEMVKPLWTLITQKLAILTNKHSISGGDIITGFPNTQLPSHSLSNFLLILGKSTIYFTYLKSLQTDNQPPNYLRMFLTRLNYRLNIAYIHHKKNNSLKLFENIWLIKNILGKLEKDTKILEVASWIIN
jgi:exonuclease III